MSVSSIATKKLVTVAKGTPIEVARRLMKEKEIRHLPVVDAADDIVGILSEKNLMNIHLDLKIPVEIFMEFPVVSMPADSTINAVALKMLEQRISCVLIIDEAKEVQGIVTTHDLLWHLVSQADARPAHSEGLSIAGYSSLETIGRIAQSLSLVGI